MESRVPIPSSCQEYFDMGNTKDAIYKIQPSASLDPFDVLCEFRNETASTIVVKENSQLTGYTSLPLTKGCADPGCFVDEITYVPSMKQIEVKISSLVQSSSSFFRL